jgi:hypothetical protein
MVEIDEVDVINKHISTNSIDSTDKECANK